MKKEFVEPEVMVYEFESTDVICTSGGTCTAELPDD